MKQNITKPLFALAIVLLLCYATDAQQMKQYDNKEKGFSLKLPSNWVKVDTADIGDFYAEMHNGAEDDSSIENMTVATEESDLKDAKEYQAAFKKENENSADRRLIKSTIVKINGAEAINLICDEDVAVEKQKITLRLTYYSFWKNKVVFALIFTTTPDRYTIMSPVFEKIAKSFVLK